MFIQPCFIRKNTPELRKKLDELGYEPNGYECFWEDNSRYIITTIDNQGYSYYTLCIKDSCLLENELFIDCGDNERLFLALAALSDDTPINSYYWFNDKLFKCEKIEIDNVLKNNTANYLLKCRCVNNPMIVSFFKEKNVRKATVEEIIEYFKNK